MVMKTLKPEERSIVNVLDAHGGTYLQKYITKEAGLSRLKTERVVAALSERRLGQVAKHGNTNRRSLAKWFHDGLHPAQQWLKVEVRSLFRVRLPSEAAS